MAYATVAGLPPVAGLWAALPALVVYALLLEALSTGPEATTALMTAIAIGPLARPTRLVTPSSPPSLPCLSA